MFPDIVLRLGIPRDNGGSMWLSGGEFVVQPGPTSSFWHPPFLYAGHTTHELSSSTTLPPGGSDSLVLSCRPEPRGPVQPSFLAGDSRRAMHERARATTLVLCWYIHPWAQKRRPNSWAALSLDRDRSSEHTSELASVADEGQQGYPYASTRRSAGRLRIRPCLSGRRPFGGEGEAHPGEPDLSECPAGCQARPRDLSRFAPGKSSGQGGLGGVRTGHARWRVAMDQPARAKVLRLISVVRGNRTQKPGCVCRRRLLLGEITCVDAAGIRGYMWAVLLLLCFASSRALDPSHRVARPHSTACIPVAIWLDGTE